MRLCDLPADTAAIIKTIELSDKKAVKRLADLGVFSGAEVILEGGSKRKKFFVIFVGGKRAGVSLAVANAVTVEKAAFKSGSYGAAEYEF